MDERAESGGNASVAACAQRRLTEPMLDLYLCSLPQLSGGSYPLPASELEHLSVDVRGFKAKKCSVGGKEPFVMGR